jgi:hypothetical protein
MSTNEPSTGARIAVILGFVLLAADGLLVLVSGLIMPYWAVGVLAAVWLGAVTVAIRGRARPGLVLATPFVFLALWAAAAWGGDAFLDWTA